MKWGYDIRGKVPEEINVAFAGKLGDAMKMMFGFNSEIGHDTRETSPDLAAALNSGNTGTWLCSTPELYARTARINADYGIMVTASHNPPCWNGFKLCKENAEPLTEREMVAIRAIIEDKLKVVVDITGSSAKDEFRAFKQMQGDHASDPLKPENLLECQEKVLKEGYQLGCVLDGDGDRIVFIDEKGKAWNGDLIGLLIAKEFFKDKNIACGERSSWLWENSLQQITPTWSGRLPVGHTNIKRAMRKSYIDFAAELSSHFYFKSTNYAESPMTALRYIMQLVAEKPLSEWMAEFKTFQSGEINFEVEDVDAIIHKLQNYSGMIKILPPGFVPNRVQELVIDPTRAPKGITKHFDNWWFNLRKSGTENKLRLNVEAKSQALLDEKVKELKGLIKKC